MVPVGRSNMDQLSQFAKNELAHYIDYIVRCRLAGVTNSNQGLWESFLDGALDYGVTQAQVREVEDALAIFLMPGGKYEFDREKQHDQDSKCR